MTDCACARSTSSAANHEANVCGLSLSGMLAFRVARASPGGASAGYLAHAAGGRASCNDRSLSVRSVLSERVHFIDALIASPQIVVAVIERRQTLRKA